MGRYLGIEKPLTLVFAAMFLAMPHVRDARRAQRLFGQASDKDWNFLS
jgi:hypothetical protein